MCIDTTYMLQLCIQSPKVRPCDTRAAQQMPKIIATLTAKVSMVGAQASWIREIGEVPLNQIRVYSPY